MRERFDAVILGMGPGGEAVASRLIAEGRRIAIIERELIGGECAYWACIPSKTLLRPAEAAGAVDRAAGVAGATLDWPATRAHRDDMIRHLDDSRQVKRYRDKGVTVFKASGRLAGPGRVEVDGRTLETDHVVIATGSTAVVPDIPGLDQLTVWTNREATTLAEIPDRVVMIGGSAVGVELGQFLHRFGAHVTILERSDRLVAREDPSVGPLIGERLAAEGIDVRTTAAVESASRKGRDSVLVLTDGTELRCDVVVIGAGRRPRTADLGLDTIGITPGDKGQLDIDDTGRLSDGVWAVGDVTAVMPFTHVAMYQARIVADTILGKPRTATYRGIPRVIFCDPEIAAVGLTRAQADEERLRTAYIEIDLARSISRPGLYEQDPQGQMGLLADRSRGVLVGAWAVAPLAGEWIHQAALAIRAEIPITVLLGQVAQFPTYSEAYLVALEKLDVD